MQEIAAILRTEFRAWPLMPGANYAVQTSADLNNWLPVFTNIAPFAFTDTNGMTGKKFYRAVYLP